MSRATEIQRMIANVDQHGYPQPDVFMSRHGYEKARCPECGIDSLVRGYTMHYYRTHTEKGRAMIDSVRLERQLATSKRISAADYTQFDPSPVDTEAWKAKAQSSHQRILDRHRPGLKQISSRL